MNISDSGKITLNPKRKKMLSRTGAWLALILGVLALAACYPAPYRMVEPSEPTVIRDTPIAPLTQLYFYPKEGQTNEQQSRDHYECYNWAVKQTGFDPGLSEIPTNQRIKVVPMPPPGHDTATLAIAGAVLGALIGGPRHAAEGALIGGTSGAIAGAVSDSQRLESARQQEEAYAARDRARSAQLDAKVRDFRRAMSACMEGRGYSVR
jgi:hypothetical protein